MISSHKIRILSRKSDLAIIQARQVGSKLLEKFPKLKIEYITKKTSGDIDLKTPLSEMGTEGVFTDDLRNDLLANECDLAVHSWKDLPLDLGKNTVLAGSLKRADQRDILFIKKNKIYDIIKNKSIKILSSSPRRMYNLKSFVKSYLPFKLNYIIFENIRGNIPSRFNKFLSGEADALVMAKAAVDRLLNNNIPELNEVARLMKMNIEKCLWTITPLSQNPTSPGQGALGIEVRHDNKKLINMIYLISDHETVDSVNQERNILKSYGGGCHQKIGVSYIPTHFGLIKIQKGETDDGKKFYTWEKNENGRNLNIKIDKKFIYPSSLSKYKLFNRRYLEKNINQVNSLLNHCVYISRSNALPVNAKIDSSNIIWTSGIKTWESLAKKGIWVNGTSDGMGENTDANVKNLTVNPWIKLTHVFAPKTNITKTIHTYILEELPIKENISSKKFFYWMSSSAFNYVFSQYPEIINAYHACGPGNTYEAIKKVIKDPQRLDIVLSYEAWRKKLL